MNFSVSFSFACHATVAQWKVMLPNWITHLFQRAKAYSYVWSLKLLPEWTAQQLALLVWWTWSQLLNARGLNFKLTQLAVILANNCSNCCCCCCCSKNDSSNELSGVCTKLVSACFGEQCQLYTRILNKSYLSHSHLCFLTVEILWSRHNYERIWMNFNEYLT